MARKLDKFIYPDEPDVPGLTFLTPIEWAPWMETIWYDIHPLLFLLIFVFVFTYIITLYLSVYFYWYERCHFVSNFSCHILFHVIFRFL